MSDSTQSDAYNKESESYNKAGFLVGLMLSICFLLVGMGILSFGLRDVHRSFQSSHWPYTQGRITCSRVVINEDGDSGSIPHADVRYSFFVDGEEMSGSMVACGDYDSSIDSHEDGIIARYPKGRKVSVYYNPANHRECLLEPGFKTQALFLPIFGAVFAAFGSFILGRLILFRRRASKKTEW